MPEASKYELPTSNKVKETYDIIGPRVFKITMLAGQALIISCVLYTAWKTHEIGCEMGIKSNFPCFGVDDELDLEEITETVVSNVTEAVSNVTEVVANVPEVVANVTEVVSNATNSTA